ncbi:peptidoglycan-binding domain-containing protein [Thermocoleostomius sinensis]|jgi:hypothetical protein|uniref:Peptidoglycan-binding domain-containing protein n=1 Tax=Thermocoleostomius sinensis A174 TaxID=2016057 RepID=A0A9E8Z9V9_9CYAN|nr:peptidoglycan-binding domain-containing protein [Thermocoleostomius sinensis]WAL58064.1 peptidoglycan-binding domain-containing protein [Thermocoleostomius sinensis A174]
METLAFLHLAEENENSQVRELTLDTNKFAGKAAIGALGIAAAAVGAFGIADSASAYGYGGCYSYDCGYNYYSYDPCYDYGCDKYYSYDPCYDYGCDKYYSYDPCYYDSCGSSHYYSYDPCYDYGCDKYYSYDPCYYDSCGSYYSPKIHLSVKEIQIALKNAGCHVYVDGVFGPMTAHAVKSFQAAHGLHVDGVVGPQTTAALLQYL